MFQQKIDNFNINFKAYNIIYNVIDDIKALMEGLLSPDIQEKILGGVEVRKTYKVSKIENSWLLCY